MLYHTADRPYLIQEHAYCMPNNVMRCRLKKSLPSNLSQAVLGQLRDVIIALELRIVCMHCNDLHRNADAVRGQDKHLHVSVYAHQAAIFGCRDDASVA